MREPVLRYKRCVRGDEATDLATGLVKVAKTSQDYRRIQRGALKGCIHKRAGRPVFKIGKGYVLEFHVVIRVSYP